MAHYRSVTLYRTSGGALLGKGLMVAARDQFRDWFKAAERAGDTAQMIAALNALNKAACERGDFDVALNRLEQARSLISTAEVPSTDQFKVMANLVTVHTALGHLDIALACAHKAEELSARSGVIPTPHYWLALSVLRWRRQEWMAMRLAADRAYELSMTSGDETIRSDALLNRGIAHLELGAPRLARRDLGAALRSATAANGQSLPYTYAELGRLHFLAGDYPQALEAGREALASLFTRVAIFDKEEVARLSRLFGSIFHGMGERNTALKYLNRAAAYFSQLGLMADWQRSTDAISQVLTEQRRPGRGHLVDEVHRLDFLTAVLDLTDDLESVDPYLRGQGERVAALASLLGEAVGLTEDELITLNYAARLHDVGMVTVDSELLHKDSDLTDSEFQRISLHAEIGAEMVKPYGLSDAGLRAIRYHHERFDGSGYPQGLQGEAIPLLARILAVADAYDALTSDRPYRLALNHAGAVGELKAMAGTSLDPNLMVRFLSLFDVERERYE